MSKKKIVGLPLAALSVVLAVYAGCACVGIVQDGLTRINTQATLQNAEEDWRHGRILESVKKYSTGTWMILEGGVRWHMAQTFLEQSKDLCYEGQFLEALDRCVTATQVLSGYDNEGAVSYECYLIDERIKHPEYFTLYLSRPWLSSGLEGTRNE